MHLTVASAMTHAVLNAATESHDTRSGGWMPSRPTCTLASLTSLSKFHLL